MTPLSTLQALDVPELAALATPFNGQAALADFPRLVEFLAADEAHQHRNRSLTWQMQTELRSQVSDVGVVGDASKHFGHSVMVPWLHLQAQAELPLPCQRCWKPLFWDLEIDRTYRFVATEAEAAEQDMGCDEDLLTLEAPLNLSQLIEDEALMDMPAAICHEENDPECQLSPEAQKALERLQAEEARLGQLAARPNPFAALATLKN
jgi:uncharacterized protein